MDDRIKELMEKSDAFYLVNNMLEDLVESRTSYDELKEMLIDLVCSIENLHDDIKN